MPSGNIEATGAGQSVAEASSATPPVETKTDNKPGTRRSSHPTDELPSTDAPQAPVLRPLPAPLAEDEKAKQFAGTFLDLKLREVARDPVGTRGTVSNTIRQISSLPNTSPDMKDRLQSIGTICEYFGTNMSFSPNFDPKTHWSNAQRAHLVALDVLIENVSPLPESLKPRLEGVWSKGYEQLLQGLRKEVNAKMLFVDEKHDDAMKDVHERLEACGADVSLEAAKTALQDTKELQASDVKGWDDALGRMEMAGKICRRFKTHRLNKGEMADLNVKISMLTSSRACVLKAETAAARLEVVARYGASSSALDDWSTALNDVCGKVTALIEAEKAHGPVMNLDEAYPVKSEVCRLLGVRCRDLSVDLERVMGALHRVSGEALPLKDDALATLRLINESIDQLQGMARRDQGECVSRWFVAEAAGRINASTRQELMLSVSDEQGQQADLLFDRIYGPYEPLPEPPAPKTPPTERRKELSPPKDDSWMAGEPESKPAADSSSRGAAAPKTDQAAGTAEAEETAESRARLGKAVEKFDEAAMGLDVVDVDGLVQWADALSTEVNAMVYSPGDSPSSMGAVNGKMRNARKMLADARAGLERHIASLKQAADTIESEAPGTKTASDKAERRDRLVAEWTVSIATLRGKEDALAGEAEALGWENRANVYLSFPSHYDFNTLDKEGAVAAYVSRPRAQIEAVSEDQEGRYLQEYCFALTQHDARKVVDYVPLGKGLPPTERVEKNGVFWVEYHEKFDSMDPNAKPVMGEFKNAVQAGLSGDMWRGRVHPLDLEKMHKRTLELVRENRSTSNDFFRRKRQATTTA